jgi:hypothetical protein
MKKVILKTVDKFEGKIVDENGVIDKIYGEWHRRILNKFIGKKVQIILKTVDSIDEVNEKQLKVT